MITVVAMLCHMVEAITSPVCHEEIVVRTQMTIMECMMGHQQAVSEWKENSRFQGDQWKVTLVRCAPGDYQPSDSI
jgi:hypothetical protein